MIAYENAKSITLNIFSSQELYIGTVHLYSSFLLTAKKKRKENAIESYDSEATEELCTYSEHFKTHVGTHNLRHLRHHRKVIFGGNLRILPFCQIHNIRYCRISFNGNLQILSFCHQHIHMILRFALLS